MGIVYVWENWYVWKNYNVLKMVIEPRKALNKAFLKIKPNRTSIELFKNNLMLLLDSIKEKESEEFHKNLVIYMVTISKRKRLLNFHTSQIA